MSRVDDGDDLSKLEHQGVDKAKKDLGETTRALTTAQEGAIVRSDKNLWRKVRRHEN